MTRDWHAVLVVALLVLRCGGKARSPDAPGAAGQKDASDAAASSEAGAGGWAAHGGSASSGAPGVNLGGAASEAGAAGSDRIDTCDPGTLWTAIVRGALGGLGTCEPSSLPAAGEAVSRSRGAVVVDADGRVIDNTGLSGSEKQAWLDSLSGRRWVCLAGETLGYRCRPAG